MGIVAKTCGGDESADNVGHGGSEISRAKHTCCRWIHWCSEVSLLLVPNLFSLSKSCTCVDRRNSINIGRLRLHLYPVASLAALGRDWANLSEPRPPLASWYGPILATIGQLWPTSANIGQRRAYLGQASTDADKGWPTWSPMVNVGLTCARRLRHLANFGRQIDPKLPKHGSIWPASVKAQNRLDRAASVFPGRRLQRRHENIRPNSSGRTTPPRCRTRRRKQHTCMRLPRVCAPSRQCVGLLCGRLGSVDDPPEQGRPEPGSGPSLVCSARVLEGLRESRADLAKLGLATCEVMKLAQPWRSGKSGRIRQTRPDAGPSLKVELAGRSKPEPTCRHLLISRALSANIMRLIPWGARMGRTTCKTTTMQLANHELGSSAAKPSRNKNERGASWSRARACVRATIVGRPPSVGRPLKRGQIARPFRLFERHDEAPLMCRMRAAHVLPMCPRTISLCCTTVARPEGANLTDAAPSVTNVGQKWGQNSTAVGQHLTNFERR